MIAPIQPPDPWVPEKLRLLRKARRIVAAMLLAPPKPKPPPACHLAPWKQWLFVGWVVVVSAAYVWTMFGK